MILTSVLMVCILLCIYGVCFLWLVRLLRTLAYGLCAHIFFESVEYC